jgi:hypothetical protein
MRFPSISNCQPQFRGSFSFRYIGPVSKPRGSEENTPAGPERCRRNFEPSPVTPCPQCPLLATSATCTASANSSAIPSKADMGRVTMTDDCRISTCPGEGTADRRLRHSHALDDRWNGQASLWQLADLTDGLGDETGLAPEPHGIAKAKERSGNPSAPDVRFGSLADILTSPRHVRFEEMGTCRGAASSVI